MRKLIAAAVMFGTAGLFVPAIARAHFNLMMPPSSANQDTHGDPQKTAPCGRPTASAGRPHGHRVRPGPVTVTIRETVFHPGHYRVALSTTGPSGLPADPAVTPVGKRPVCFDGDSESARVSGARGRHAPAHERAQRDADRSRSRYRPA